MPLRRSLVLTFTKFPKICRFRESEKESSCAAPAFVRLAMTPHKEEPSSFATDISRKFKKKEHVVVVANAIGDVIQEQGGPLSPAAYLPQKQLLCL